MVCQLCCFAHRNILFEFHFEALTLRQDFHLCDFVLAFEATVDGKTRARFYLRKAAVIADCVHRGCCFDSWQEEISLTSTQNPTNVRRRLAVFAGGDDNVEGSKNKGALVRNSTSVWLFMEQEIGWVAAWIDHLDPIKLSGQFLRRSENDLK